MRARRSGHDVGLAPQDGDGGRESFRRGARVLELLSTHAKRYLYSLILALVTGEDKRERSRMKTLNEGASS